MNNIIRQDLSKVRFSVNRKSLLTALLFNQSFKRIYYFRKFQQSKSIGSLIWKFLNRIISSRYSVYISKNAKIGGGFCIGHCFSIIVSECVIGDDVTIMQQVTIGSSRGGKRAGFPTIGNRVFIGAGAKIIGNVTIGNDVMIGANAVVTKDIPSGAVVGGVPAKVLSMDGKEQTKYWCSNMKDYNELVK